MKYYDEEKMHDLRLLVEKEVLGWPEVTSKKMYGCPCYKYQDKLFAFLVTDGVVLVRVSEQDKIDLTRHFDIKPFQTSANRTMKNWPQIPLNKESDLKKIIPYIKQSYNLSKQLK
jgi:predicted DNA-binding protein (MmcQ/YjbR family)